MALGQFFILGKLARAPCYSDEVVMLVAHWGGGLCEPVRFIVKNCAGGGGGARRKKMENDCSEAVECVRKKIKSGGGGGARRKKIGKMIAARQ